MALIKSAQSNRLLKEAIVLDMGDLDRQARRILNEAREQAAQILKQARTDAVQIAADAQAQGHKQGLEQGLSEGRESGAKEAHRATVEQYSEHFERLTQGWTDALNAWSEARTIMFNEAREDVIAFAMTLAKKVVHRMIAVDASIIADQLAEALRLLNKPTAIEIVIHPDDRALVEQVLPQLMASLASHQHAAIREDATMMRGGCLVRTAGGRVDASIETQLVRIAELIVPEGKASAEE